MTRASPGGSAGVRCIGPHWWNGPRAHDDAVSPAPAHSPGNCGSCPKASSCQAVSGDPPSTSRCSPIPYARLRIVDSTEVRLVFGSLYAPPTSSHRPSASSRRRNARSAGTVSHHGLR